MVRCVRAAMVIDDGRGGTLLGDKGLKQAWAELG